MLSKILKFGALGALALVFAACAKPFVGTELTPEGHQMSYSQSKPMGCMLVGEKQGVARKGKTDATIGQLKESAKNDMVNNAAFLQQVGASKGGNKRLVAYIAKEEWGCGKYEAPCKEREPDISDVSILKVYGEVYECNF